MKKNFLFYSHSNKLNESNIISANRYEINKLTHFSFSINGCYAIFEGRILAWIPPSQNLYFDSLEFLQYEPIELDNFGSKKILKLYCNDCVIHSISEDGLVYSWGNDREKTGILGLGFSYNQPKPILNTNFVGKKIIDISLSDKHAAAIDINRQVYTWGKGSDGELGLENVDFSNIPVPINIGKKLYVDKVQCGQNFTAMIDCNRNCLYMGKIYKQSNFNKLITIENISVNDIFTGNSVLAIIDSLGNLFLYNDEENLYKVKIDKKIKTVKFNQSDFYAMTNDSCFLYEFIFKKDQSFSFKNYVENLIGINKEFVNRFSILDTPYYTSLLFYLIECLAYHKDIISKGKKNIFYSISSNIRNEDESSNKTILSDEKIIDSLRSEGRFNKESVFDISNTVLPPNFKNHSVLSESHDGFLSKRIGKISNMLERIFDKKLNQIDKNRRLSIDPNKPMRFIQLERISSERKEHNIMQARSSSIKSEQDLFEFDDNIKNYNYTNEDYKKDFNKITNAINITYIPNTSDSMESPGYSPIHRRDNSADTIQGKSAFFLFKNEKNYFNKIKNVDNFHIRSNSRLNNEFKIDNIRHCYNVENKIIEVNKESNGSDEYSETTEKKNEINPETITVKNTSSSGDNKKSEESSNSKKNPDKNKEDSNPFNKLKMSRNKKSIVTDGIQNVKSKATRSALNIIFKDIREEDLQKANHSTLNYAKDDKFNSSFENIFQIDNSKFRSFDESLRISLIDTVNNKASKPYIKPKKGMNISLKNKNLGYKDVNEYLTEKNETIKIIDRNENSSQYSFISPIIQKSTTTLNNNISCIEACDLLDEKKSLENSICKNKLNENIISKLTEIRTEQLEIIREKKDSVSNKIVNKYYESPKKSFTNKSRSFTRDEKSETEKLNIEDFKKNNKIIENSKLEIPSSLRNKKNVPHLNLNKTNYYTKQSEETNFISSRDNFIKIVDDNMESERSSQGVNEKYLSKPEEPKNIDPNLDNEIKNNKSDISKDILKKVKAVESTRTPTVDIKKLIKSTKSPSNKYIVSKTIHSKELSHNSLKQSNINTKPLFLNKTNITENKKILTKNSTSNPNFKKQNIISIVKNKNNKILQENYFLSQLEKTESFNKQDKPDKQRQLKKNVSHKKNKTANSSIEKPFIQSKLNNSKINKNNKSETDIRKKFDNSVETIKNNYSRYLKKNIKDIIINDFQYNTLGNEDKEEQEIFCCDFEDNNKKKPVETFRERIINNLENFKLDRAKEKIEDKLKRIKSITEMSPNDKVYLPSMINEDKDKISIYEPFELDRSQLTNLMNASYRRSFNSISLADISNKRDSDKNLLKIRFNTDKDISEPNNDNRVNANENEKIECNEQYLGKEFI